MGASGQAGRHRRFSWVIPADDHENPEKCNTLHKMGNARFRPHVMALAWPGRLW